MDLLSNLCGCISNRNKSGQTTQDAAKQQQSQRQLQGCPFTASTLVLFCTIQVMTSTSPVPTHHTQVFGIYTVSRILKKGYDVSVSKYIVIPFGKLYRGAPNRTRNSGHSARPRKKGTGNCFLGNFKNVEIHRIEVSVLMLWGVYKVGPITPQK